MEQSGKIVNEGLRLPQGFVITQSKLKRSATFQRYMPKRLMFEWKLNKVILIVLVFLQIALGLIYLKTVPRIYTDEVWDSSLGYSLAYGNGLKHPFIEGFGGMHIHFVQPRVVLPFVCAAIFKITGYSILAGRMGSLLFSVLAIVSLYELMRRWFGEKQAFYIAIATILHPWFFEVSRRIRPEIYYIALAITALWCIVYSLDTNSGGLALFGGVLAGLAALSHPTGVILDVAIAGAVLIWVRTKRIWRLAIWACFGFVVIILPYVIYVLWSVKNPGVNFFEQMQSGFARVGPMLGGEIRRWKNFIRWPVGIPLAVIMMACWFWAWYRSNSADKILATIIALFALILPFVSTNVAGRYLAALVPFFCALIVRMVWRVTVEHRAMSGFLNKCCFVSCVGAAVVYLLVCVAAISMLLYRLHGADFTRVVNRIASVAGGEDSVYGQEVLWIGHNRYRYGPFPLDASTVPFGQTIDMVRKHHFNYAVRSGWTFGSSYGVARPPSEMPSFRTTNPIDNVCKQFGTKVDEFYDPYFGPFEIYKLNW